MAKKKRDENGFAEYKKLFVYQFSQHTKALADINTAIDNLRKEVLERSIPDIKQDVADVKGQAKAWAITLALVCSGIVSTAIAFFK